MTQSRTTRTPPAEAAGAATDGAVLAALMQGLSTCVFVKDRQGRYVLVNRAMARLLGCNEPEELQGRTDADLFHPDKARAIRMEEDRLLHDGQPVPDRLEVFQQGGRTTWISIGRTPLRNAAGEITGILGIGTDLSEHLQQEQREQTATQDLKAVVEIADRLIAAPDLDSLLRMAVELARSLLRVERCSILLNRGDHLVGTYGTDLQGRTTDERDKVIPMDAAWENRFRMWDQKTSQWIIERDIQRSSPDARAAPVRDFWVATTPIKGSHNRMIGVFCNDAVISGHPPDEHLQDIIAVFCSLLGNMLERQDSIDDIRNRDQILDGVARSSSHLLMVDDIEPAIRAALRVLGESLRVDRTCIYQNRQDPLTGEWTMSHRYEWVQHPALPTAEEERLQDLPYQPDFADLFEQLAKGGIAEGLAARQAPGPRRLLESLQVVSFLRVPIHINNQFWGFIGFDDARAPRSWSANEKTILLAMAGNLGAAISREATGRQLKARDRILGGVARANHELLTNPDVERAIGAALRILGPAVNARRIFLCENRTGPQRDHPLMVPRHLYDNETGTHWTFDARETALPYREFFPGWYDIMAAGRMIRGRLLDFLTGDSDRVHAVLMMPLIVERRFWGILGFDTPETGYEWTETDESTLSTVAGSISAAIARHRAEDTLRRSEELFRSLIENASDLILMVDSRGDLLYGSPSVGRVLGFGEQPLPRVNFFNLIHAEDLTGLRMIFENGGAGGLSESQLHPIRLRHQRGEWLTLECAFRRIRDENGSPRFIINARDITERIRTEQALHRSEEMLRHSQKMEAVGRLAGGVAHDFNNLLTAILGYSDLLVAQIPASSGLRSDVLEIARAAERAHSLTRQLLAFSRRQVLEPRSVDLNTVVVEMERMLNRLISENVQLTTAIAPEPCIVKVDRGQIEQVIVNLCLNARDAMPEGGQLHIATEHRRLAEPMNRGMVTVPPGDYAVLRVRDTGHGIHDEIKPLVFEPFFTTKEVGKGTGLGLSMVYGIVEQSAGHILFESAVDAGTEFVIYLPRAVETDPAAPAPVPAGASTYDGKEHILLIEDDQIVRDLSTRILEGRGYRVTTRANGALGLEYFRQHADRIDLVLTDIIMPQMSGIAFARAARSIKPGQRILFISGYAENQEPESEEIGGRRSYIQKPFTVSTLCGRVREILDTPVTGQPST